MSERIYACTGYLDKGPSTPQKEDKGAETGISLPHGRCHCTWVCISVVGERNNDFIFIKIYYRLSGEDFKVLGRINFNFADRAECVERRTSGCGAVCLYG